MGEFLPTILAGFRFKIRGFSLGSKGTVNEPAGALFREQAAPVCVVTT
jgi:hypothetical protein